MLDPHPPAGHDRNLDRNLDRIPLHTRTDGINARLEGLTEVLLALRDRLEPVLAPQRPAVARELTPDRSGEASWLADYLDATARRLEDTITDVRDLLERIEL